jgi:hypothetical protein
MMIVSTTGYIIACIGPFFSDFNNNDASIMQNILFRNTDKIVDWLNEVRPFLNVDIKYSFSRMMWSLLIEVSGILLM